MNFRAAAFTMVYNESYFLPAWCRYYGEQLGYANIYVLDHGSTDGCVDNVTCNRIRLPRGILDEEERATIVSSFHQSLLAHHDVVIYTDCDEFIVPCPDKFPALLPYLRQCAKGVTRCVGIDVTQQSPNETKLNLSSNILKQRPYAVATHWSAKPVVASVPIQWMPGFHDCEQPSTLDLNLWLIHLKLADMDYAFKRLAVTRCLPWRDGRFGGSHRISDAAMTNWFKQRQASLTDDYLNEIDFANLIAQKAESNLCRLPESFLGML